MTAENRFLLYALFMGIFITFVYDFIRIFRRVVPHGTLWISLEDLGFWIYCGVEVFLLMYHESDGTLRWFAVLGAFVGMFLYKKLISTYFVKYVSLGIIKLLAPLKKFLSWVSKPFVKVIRVLKEKAKSAKGKIKRNPRRIRWYLKKKLTFLLKMLKMTI